ncbi:formylglycine-generating enzyme family protein [Sphingomonas sp. PB4P5]|uniref:formylglycine-generating enzyme family protein n=1 Tax=Parasphingomonas puruogangriensis TaxID=3096155 RepID=UPI002FC63B9F
MIPIELLTISLLSATTTTATKSSNQDDKSRASVIHCAECPPMVPVTVTVEGVPRRYMVGKFEVTWKEYMLAFDDKACPAPVNLDGKLVELNVKDVRDNFPMTSIRPVEIGCYLTWLRKKTTKPYRLSSEVEWAAIARKASGREKLLISDIGPTKAYVGGVSHNDWSYTRDDPRYSVEWRVVNRVGSYGPDRLGLYDLFGNASEVMSDPMIYSSLSKTASDGTDLAQVLVKGGSLGSNVNFDVILGRERYVGAGHSARVGFRVMHDDIGPDQAK